MWHSCKGCVIIHSNGKNQERFLNLLRQAGIPVHGVCMLGRGEMELTIPAADFKRIRPMVRECGCRIHIVRRQGILFWILRGWRRPGLWGSILLMLALMTFTSTRVLWIFVTGNERIPQAIILRALEEEGLEKFGTLPKEDFNTIAARARHYDDRIAWISIQRKGAFLTAKVVENEPITSLVDPAEPCDVVAVKDGVIVSTEVYEGHTLLKPGDVVAAGDVLIEGEFFPETNEEVLQPLQVHARGQILANVQYYAEYAVENKREGLADSGKSAPYRAVMLFNWKLFETEPVFPQYEVRDVSRTALTDSVLPVYLVDGLQAEQTMQQLKLTEQEQKELALANAEQLAFLKIPKDAKIIQKKAYTELRNNVVIGIVSVITEESIGLERAFTS